MLSDTTVRASDGRILNAAGSAPYAPSAPGDAQRVEGDPQAFLVLKSPDGEDAVRQPVAQTSPLVCTGPDCQQSVEVPVEQGAARLDVVVNFTGANGAPAPLGQVTVNLVDPAGTVVDSGNVQATPNAPGSVALGVDEPVPGTWLVQVNGAGVYTASVDSVAAYDDHPFIVLTWDDVTLV